MTDFEKIHSFESLYNAYRKARQGKRWKGAAAKFEVNLLEALNLLSAQIRTKRYTMSPYNTFEVYEPKRRVVMSNSYKDKVVQLVKEKLGIKYYGRYMDDFFLIHHDKAYLQECRKQIEAFVQARGLSLNAKTNIFPLKHGVDFLGFHTYLTESGAVIRKVRRRSKNNMKRKLKKLAALHAAGRIDAKTVEQSYQSWRGHAEKGNSYHLIRRTDQYYNSLMKSKEAAQCQKH